MWQRSRFAARGASKDIYWVVSMALVIGVAGMIGPWLTGRVFDSAIPSAAPSELYAIGLALFGTAIANSLFSSYKVKAGPNTRQDVVNHSGGVWDRLLNLPIGFFSTPLLPGQKRPPSSWGSPTAQRVWRRFTVSWLVRVRPRSWAW